jgi:hypothetical protein
MDAKGGIMAQLEKTVYTVDRDPVVVESNASATWFAGVLIAMVVVIIGVFMMLINTSNNENASQLDKMQQDQNVVNQQQADLNAQQAAQSTTQAQQAATDARQANKQLELNQQEVQQAPPPAPALPPVPAPQPQPVQDQAPAPANP